METLTNNSLKEKELFYRLNEQFDSSRAGDIFFLQQEILSESSRQ